MVCRYFYRTWTPGYNSEYIDPNLAYTYQRRLDLAKKIAWWVFILSLIIALIVLLIAFSSKSQSIALCASNKSDVVATDQLHVTGIPVPGHLKLTDSNRNSNKSDAEGIDKDHVPIMKVTDIKNSFNGSDSDTNEDEFQDLSELVKTFNKTDLESDFMELSPTDSDSEDPFNESATTVDADADQTENVPDPTDPVDFELPDSDETSTLSNAIGGGDQRLQRHTKGVPLPLDSNKIVDRDDERNYDCDALSEPFICDKKANATDRKCVQKDFVCDSVQDCPNGQDEALCTWVSESLTTISMNRNRKSLIGYVLVRVKGSWHPYCTDKWNWKMGLQICNFLGYNTMIAISTVELDDLNRQTGAYVTGMGNGNNENETRSPLWLLGGEVDYDPITSGPLENVVTQPTTVESYNCTVAHIRCEKRE